MLQCSDRRKYAFNKNRINYFNNRNYLPRNAILVNDKIIADSIWKWYSEAYIWHLTLQRVNKER